MRVAFGVTALAQGLAGAGVDGIGSVTRELMPCLRRVPGLELLPFEFAARVSDQIPGAVAAGDFKRQALASLASGLPFPRTQACLAGRVDLVHATDHYIPRLRATPVLATLMDAIPLAHPEWVNYRFKRLKNAMWRRSAHWADHVVTISEFSRAEVVRHFRLPEARVSVMPLGVDARWFQLPDDAALARVRDSYALPARFFLFVGTLQPRKNLAVLIAAHGRLPKALREDCPLIVIGREGWGGEETVARLKSGSLPGVRWLRYVPHDDLPVVMRQATALLFPSLYEGFGLPVLEAFAAGAPVLASNATSIPEVAQDAASLLDPRDADAWQDAMTNVLESGGLRADLQARGLLRAQEMSWTNAATRLHEIYVDVLGRV